MAAPRYSTRFTISAHVYQPAPEMAGEIHASLDRLKGLLPADVDPAAHPTLLYVVGNLFVAGTANRNDDAVTLEDGLRMYRAFEGQQINVEHSRASVVGYIVKAGLSEYGTDRLITEDEARAAGQPVNVAIVVALWKVVDRELVQYILDAAAVGKQDTLSLSFEVGFDAYSVVVLPSGVINLAAAKRVIQPSDPEYPAWDARLRVNKGSGVSRGGDRVGRVLIWPIIPMGGGIVATPAGAVKGITPITAQAAEGEGDIDEADAGMYQYSSTQCTLAANDAIPFLEYGASLAEERLYHSDDPEKEGRYGRESEIHCTICYGIVGSDAVPIQLALQGCGPVRATLGKVNAFTADERYDVLHVEVHSDDLNRLHALIKATVQVESKWPTYQGHCTIAYMRKGAASPYIGDTRFEGKTLTFNSITFSPAEGDREEIWLEQPTIPPGPIASVATVTVPAQTDQQLVYSSSEPSDLGLSFASMPSAPSRTLKLSAGWQDKLATIVAADKAVVAKAMNGDGCVPAYLPHGIDVTLSDGRVIKAMKVIDAATLGSDIECSYDGCVITSMTPGVAAPEYLPPDRENVYPTVDAAQAAKDAAILAIQQKAIHEGYVGASVAKVTEIIASLTRAGGSLAASLCTNTAAAGVSPSSPPSTPPIMDLNTLKQAVAAVKTVEDLPTVMANVASFVDIIAAASAEQATARATAEAAAAASKVSLAEVQAQLATLSASHNALVAAQQAAAAEQTFQTRMASVEEVFAFDDETRADIMPEIKALADEAAFASWLPKAKRLYKGYLKAAATAAGENPFAKKGEKDDEKEEKDCKAAAQTALASAATTVVDAPVHNSIEGGTVSLKERFTAIMSRNTSIGGVKVSELETQSRAVKKTS